MGGCSLMIKVECYWNGFYFLEKLFKKYVEIEGFVKLVKYMGYGVYGLLFLNVFYL